MNVLYITSSRIVKYNNAYYCDTSLAVIINRYYKTFDNLTVTGKTCDERIPQHVEINPEIDVIQCGNTVDIYMGRNIKSFQNKIKMYDLLILRLPSVLGNQLASLAVKNNIPCMAEVVGNAWDSLWNHGYIGKILAPSVHYYTKKYIKQSQYALYVTEKYLQSVYPSDGCSIGVSDVYIENNSDEIINKRIKKIEMHEMKEVSLMTAAAVNVKYKGQEYVIKAIPLLNKCGIKVKYYIVGKGDCSYLMKLAQTYSVEEQVIFTGGLSRKQVFEYLDKTDIYVQPSLLEGLPRAVVEAMSRGCICIGSNVGGIPELIEEKMLFKPKSHEEIAEKILHLNNKNVIEKIAVQNIQIAKKYEEKVLESKRNSFLNIIKNDILESLRLNN